MTRKTLYQMVQLMKRNVSVKTTTQIIASVLQVRRDVVSWSDGRGLQTKGDKGMRCLQIAPMEHRNTLKEKTSAVTIEHIEIVDYHLMEEESEP